MRFLRKTFVQDLILMENVGHVRPLIHLSARIVKLRPIVVTFVTTNAFYERAKTELTRSFEDEESAKRVR